MIRTPPIALVLLLVTLAGCSSAPPALPEPDPVFLPALAPPDFTLSVTVVGPSDPTQPEVEEVPRAEQPSRYVVEPDGVLRAAIGPGATPRVYPRQTRRLTSDQVQRLWRLTTDTGLLETTSLSRIDNTETFFPQRSRPTALVYIRREGEATHHAVRLPVGDAESAGVGRLVEELAELAWLGE